MLLIARRETIRSTVAIIAVLGCICPSWLFSQASLPTIQEFYGVYPREIPVGNSETMVEIRGSGFTLDSVIQINGQDIPTDHTRLEGMQIPLLTGLIPSSFLAEARLLDIRVLNLYGGASAPVTIEVKPRLQPATIEISISAIAASRKDRLELSVRLTNEGKDPFYVPTRLTPFTGGNVLNSYHFEIKRPNAVVFKDPIRTFLDGFIRGTEETLLANGSIAVVRPGESYSASAQFSTDEFATPGEYTLRLRFDPQYPSGADQYKIKFLSETLLSNSVTLKIGE
jgi:hypothetical protein